MALCCLAMQAAFAAGRTPVLTPQPAPELSAEAAILIDAQTGIVLYQRNAHARKYPASTTKTMTGLLCVEHGELEKTHTISERAAAVGEASLNLFAGQQIKLRDLLTGVLLKSANDGSVAVAEIIGGDYDGFIKMMNARVAELGLSETHFVNPHGLHDANHYSSAHDLAYIARAAMRLPEFAEIVAKHEAVIPWPKKPEGRKFENLNRLLPKWDAVDGVKTGYTSQAGRCLIGSATVDGWRLIAVCLKCQDSWSDCEALLRWGFDNYQMTKVIAAGVGGYECDVKRGDVRTVTAVPTEDLFLPVSRRVEPPRPRVQLAPVEAPVELKQHLGTLRISYRGATYEMALEAGESVGKSVWATLAESRERVAAVLLLVALSLGVLVHGTTAKIARARWGRIPQRKREAHLSRARVGEWQGGH